MPHPPFALHVGLPKCASSSLQTFFWSHRTWFRSQGLVYPDAVQAPSNPKHQWLVNGLLRPDFNPTVLDTLRGQAPRLLVSTEGLSTHFDAFAPASVQRTRQFFRNRGAIAFLVYRPPAAFLRSYYAQCVLNPRTHPLYATTLTLTAFAQQPLVRRFLDWRRLAADMRGAWNLQQMVEISLDDHLLENVAHCLGVRLPDDAPLTTENQRPEGHVVEMIRQVNHLPDPLRNRCVAQIQQWAQTRNYTLALHQHGAEGASPESIAPQVWDCLVPHTGDDWALTQDHIDAFREHTTKARENTAPHHAIETKPN